jgi:hypothetical protein
LEEVRHTKLKVDIDFEKMCAFSLNRMVKINRTVLDDKI